MVGHVARGEVVLSEPQEDACFSYRGIADDDQLEEMVVSGSFHRAHFLSLIHI